MKDTVQIEELKKSILKQADIKRNAIIKETKQVFDEKTKMHLEKLENKEKETLDAEEKELINKNNMLVQKISLENKKTIADKRDKLNDILFDSIEKSLTKHLESQDYLETLRKYIVEAKSAIVDDEILIYLNERDLEKYKNDFSKIRGIIWKKSDEDFYAGLIAKNKNGSIELNRTFEHLINRAKEEFSKLRLD